MRISDQKPKLLNILYTYENMQAHRDYNGKIVTPSKNRYTHEELHLSKDHILFSKFCAAALTYFELRPFFVFKDGKGEVVYGQNIKDPDLRNTLFSQTLCDIEKDFLQYVKENDSGRKKTLVLPEKKDLPYGPEIPEYMCIYDYILYTYGLERGKQNEDGSYPLTKIKFYDGSTSLQSREKPKDMIRSFDLQIPIDALDDQILESKGQK